MRSLGYFIVLLLCAVTGALHAAPLPGDAGRLLPQLSAEVDRFWPDLAPRAFVPAVIEQESGWKPGATLRTGRELGCGLGQFTVAYDASGGVRFDALSETRRLDRSLAGWSWRDCYATQYQLRAVVLKLKAGDRDCALLLHGAGEVKACDAAKYNGGAGSVNKRIRSCRVTAGCDATRWFGHLERQCPQSRTKAAGYGEDFCTINSKYPARVFARMPKYEGKL